MVFEQKPILLISSSSDLDMIATYLYLRGCIERTQDVIHAEEATGHQGGASPEEILAHLRENTDKYSAIIVSKSYSDQIPHIKEVIPAGIPIVCYGMFSREEKKGADVPCAGFLPRNELSEILTKEWNKRAKE